MKIFTFSLALLLFIACKDNQSSNVHNPPVNQEPKSNQSSSIYGLDNAKEDIVWNEVTIKNFTFKLPSNFRLDNNNSNYNKKVYIAEQETLGLSIDIADLPNGYENSVVSDMVTNLNDFGNSINQENNRHFNDFKLLNSKFTNLGNNSSVEVTQTSTKVSGKNISMIVKAYFTIANPYYFSITFSYPGNSFEGEQIINKIKDSFKFDIPQNRNESTTQIEQTNQPSLSESSEWLVNKLSDNLVEYFDSTDMAYGPMTFWSHYYKNVGINDGNLIFEYQEKTDRPKGYGEIGHNTTLENIKVIIPFNKIINNKFDNYRTSSGKCDFQIYAQSNSITEINLTTGEKRFKTFYEFSFDCSVDENLGSRIDKAILHIKELTPSKAKSNNEPF